MKLKHADLEKFRKRLLDEQAEIRREDSASSADRGTVVLDQQSIGRLSRMDAMQRQAMAQAASRRRMERENRIRATLKRLDEDEFGYCQDCGEEIGESRLHADPTVAFCISCAAG